MKRLRPDLIDRVAVVAESPLSPGLPFILSARLPEATLEAAREALFDTLADPDLSAARTALGLKGARVTTPEDYERVLEIEREAEAAGYPTLV